VVRRPLVWGAAATIVMLAIAAPALGIRLAYPAIDAPANLPVVSTIEAIGAAFPQSPTPAEVVVTGQYLTGPAVTGAIASLESMAAQSGGPIREPVTATPVADGQALIVSVPLAGNGGDAASYNALDTLRDRILPETLGKAGVSYAVTGDTAVNHDDASQLSSRTPLVLAVVAAAFCLLLLAFRSVVLPLVSIALNFLSVAAAYGLITFIFQDGRLQGPLGYTSSGAITPSHDTP
jgi:putative drug exporter of the RND superfamily